jgi:ubiquinone/menaquinone biosynthesis C-methylase UbiE
MTGSHEWEGRTGESWAEQWKRTDRSFGGLTDRLLARARDLQFRDVLDIGCGAGELSLALARNHSSARIVGVDISPQLISAARDRGRNHTSVSFELADAAEWASSTGVAPDFLISRHGVMFFGDPVAAFAHLAVVAAPGARLLFSCFRGPSENEIFTGISALLPPPASPPDPEAPGPMAFADPNRVLRLLTEAGWTDIAFERFDFAMVAGTGEDAVSDAIQYFMKIGPAAAAMAEMDDSAKAEIVRKLRVYLASRTVGNIVALGAGAWIVSAKRA